MSETLPTDALSKLGNDVFYDIRVLSAKVNSLLITAKDSPEKPKSFTCLCLQRCASTSKIILQAAFPG